MDEPKVIQMTADEVKTMTEKLGTQAGEKINELFDEAKKGNQDSISEVKKMVDEIKSIDSKGIVEYVKAVQEQANQHEAMIVELKKRPTNAPEFKHQLTEVIGGEHKSMLEALKSKRAYEFKTVGDMSTGNYTDDVIIPQYLSGINPVAKRRTTLYDVLSKVPWATNVVNYVENSGGEGDIDAVAESGKFNQKDYDWTQRSMTLSKIAAYSKVTQEMIENSQNVVSFAQNELVRDTLLALDNDILKGDGNAPTMKGLQHSDHYTAAAIPDSYELASGITPTEMDILRAIVTQQYNAHFSPGVILCHPTDVMKMDLARTAYGYLMPPFTSVDNTRIKGVPIIEHANLTEGTFHVIDPTRVNLYIQRGINFKIWDQNSTDPIYDLLTFTASVKAGVLVKNNDKAANIYGDFSTLIAAMSASES